MAKKPDAELPDLNLKEEEAGTKLFNIKLTPQCIQRLKIIKADLKFSPMTWEKTFDIFVHMACQAGILSEQTIRELQAIPGAYPESISSETKAEYGLGTRWPEAGGLLVSLRNEIQTNQTLLAGVQDALQDLAAANAAAELIAQEDVVEEEPPPEPREGELFPPTGGKQ